MKKTLYLVAVLALLVTATACGNPSIKNGKEAVAQINGKSYTADDLYKELKGQYGYTTVMNWVDKTIAESEVETTSEIEAYAKEAIEFYTYYAQAYSLSLSDFCANYLGLSGITSEDDLKEYVILDRKLSIAVTNRVASKVKDKEVADYYKENYKKVYTYRDILVTDGDDATDTTKKILKELKGKKGDKLVEKFEELAKKYSEASTKDDGGLVKEAIKADVDSEVWKKLEKLDDKKYSTEAIKGADGYHIILRVSKDKAKELDEVKDEIKQKIAEKKLTDDQFLNYDILTELRNKYKLVFKDSDIKKKYDEALKELENNKKEASNSNTNSNSNKK